MLAQSARDKATPRSTATRRTETPLGIADIVTPYNADAFQYLIDLAGLSNSFPFLADSIRHGFTMGYLPPILETDAPPNAPSLLEHKDVIEDWLDEELSLGRLEGPYTQQEVERRLGGPFRSSPLGVVEKSDKPGKYRIVRNTSFKGKSGVSVNDSLDSDDFPTQWGTAAMVGDFVSLVLEVFGAQRGWQSRGS